MKLMLNVWGSKGSLAAQSKGRCLAGLCQPDEYAL